MTDKEALKTLDIAIAEVEWNYPMDYAIAFETAQSALRERIERNNGWISVEHGADGAPAGWQSCSGGCARNYSHPWEYCANCELREAGNGK